MREREGGLFEVLLYCLDYGHFPSLLCAVLFFLTCILDLCICGVGLVGTLVAEWNTGVVLAYIRFLTKQQPPFLAAVGNSRTYFSLYKQVALVSNNYMGKSFN